MLLIFRLMSAIFLIIRIPVCNPYGIFWKITSLLIPVCNPYGVLFAEYPMSRRDNLWVENILLEYRTYPHIP